MSSPAAASEGLHDKRLGDQPIQLRFDVHHRVEIIGEDQDRFYTTVSDAARACKQADNLDRWIKQVKEFLSEIHKWCKDHESVVASAFVTWCDGHFNVVLVTIGDEYRFDFDDAVTGLNLHLSSMYPDIPVDAIQIPHGPEGTLHSFVNPEKAMQPYGKPIST